MESPFTGFHRTIGKGFGHTQPLRLDPPQRGVHRSPPRPLIGAQEMVGNDFLVLNHGR